MKFSYNACCHRLWWQTRKWRTRRAAEEFEWTPQRARSDILQDALIGRPHQSEQPSFTALASRAIFMFLWIRLSSIYKHTPSVVCFLTVMWKKHRHVQLDISLVRYAHSWAIELYTWREIPYLRAPSIILYLFQPFVRSKQLRTIKTQVYNDIFTSLRRKKVQSPAKQFKELFSLCSNPFQWNGIVVSEV